MSGMYTDRIQLFTLSRSENVRVRKIIKEWNKQRAHLQKLSLVSHGPIAGLVGSRATWYLHVESKHPITTANINFIEGWYDAYMNHPEIWGYRRE